MGAPNERSRTRRRFRTRKPLDDFPKKGRPLFTTFICLLGLCPLSYEVRLSWSKGSKLDCPVHSPPNPPASMIHALHPRPMRSTLHPCASCAPAASPGDAHTRLASTKVSAETLVCDLKRCWRSVMRGALVALAVLSNALYYRPPGLLKLYCGTTLSLGAHTYCALRGTPLAGSGVPLSLARAARVCSRAAILLTYCTAVPHSRSALILTAVPLSRTVRSADPMASLARRAPRTRAAHV